MAEIRYEWTGDFRIPEKYEWFLDPYGYLVQANRRLDYERFILRRVEVSDDK